MGEKFKVTEANLRELAEHTVGGPIPEGLRGQVDGMLARDETPDFYAGFVSGLNAAVQLLSAIEDAGALKGVFMAFAIRGAKLYFGALGEPAPGASEGAEEAPPPPPPPARKRRGRKR